VLCLSATAYDDLLQDVLERMHKVHELLRTVVESTHRPQVQVNCSPDYLVLLLFDVNLRFFEFCLRYLHQRGLAPPIIPDDDAFVEKCWVLSTEALEVRMGVVQAHDN
jgi:hypothetical protein